MEKYYIELSSITDVKYDKLLMEYYLIKSSLNNTEQLLHSSTKSLFNNIFINLLNYKKFVKNIK